MNKITIEKIGFWQTPIQTRQQAPKQGREDALEGEIVIDENWADGLTGIRPGSSVWVLSYFDQGVEPTTMVHPRGDKTNPQTGLFNTRSPNRPAPIGLTLVKVLSIDRNRLSVRGVDALDGTPVLDIKPYKPKLDTVDPT